MDRSESPKTKMATTTAKEIPDALRNFDQLPDTAYVRLPVVCGLFGFSSATLWRKVKDGFPRPRKLSTRITGWNVGELRQVLDK